MKATKGIEKMQHLARDKIYWQGMDADITEICKKLQNMYQTQSNASNSTHVTKRYSRRTMARPRSRFFPPQQLRLPPHRRHIL